MSAHKLPNGEFVHEVNLPPEWETAKVIGARSICKSVEPWKSGAHMVVDGVLLDDGTNIFYASWATGHRVARVCALNDWALEERFFGTPPTDARELAQLNKIWSWLLNIMIEAGKKTEAELGPWSEFNKGGDA